MAISERNAESDSSLGEELAERSDAELLKEFSGDRDSTAFSTLVNRHYGMVLGVAKRMLGCPHAAEDVVQATFIVLANKANQIRKRDSLASWLYGVAFRISARTAHQRAKSTVSILDEDVMVSDDPLEQLTAQCEQNSVLEELNRLPEKIRACMVLRYLQGKSNAQVAEEMSLSESAVEGRLKRGRNQLRFRLARQGVGFAAAVALLETMRQEAAATAVPEAISQAITAAVSQPPASAIDGAENEAIRLAEQEMMKMVTSKIFSSVLATALAVGVVTTGWNLVGNAIALGQGGVAQQNRNGTIVVQPTSKDTRATPRATSQFKAKRQNLASQNTLDDPFGEDAAESPTPRELGYYSVDKPSANELTILSQLRQPTSFSFQDTTLSEICEIIKGQHGLPVLIDEAALAEDDLDASSETITIELEGVSLKNALDLTLDKLGLAAVMHKEVLFITTKTVTDELLVTRVYPRPRSWSITEDQLMESILAAVGPNSWEDVGGPGTITSVTNGLVISNSLQVHDEINKLFAKLDKLYSKGSVKTPNRRQNRSLTPRRQSDISGSSQPSAPSGADPFADK